MDIRLILFLKFVFLVKVLTTPIDTPEFDCGCYFNVEKTANCSNQKNIDFKCLSDKEPVKALFNNNGYTTVPEELFQGGFKKTRVMDFSHNNIDRLPDGLTESFPNLWELKLDYNNLTDPNELMRIKSPLKASAHNNPFQCDCKNKSQVISRTNEMKMTLICYVNESGKIKRHSFGKYCNERDIKKEQTSNSRSFFSFMTTALIIIAVVVISVFLIISLWSIVRPVVVT